MKTNLRRASASPSDPGRSAFDWARDAQLGPELAREIRIVVRRRRRRRLAGATVAATVAVIAGLLWRERPASELRPVALVTARPAAIVVAPARRDLPDGSTVELKDGAEIRVEFSPAVRGVALLRGEAHFQVAKDAARPFVVAAGGVSVRAVGTAFSVERGERAIEVVVTEGTVAVKRTDSNPGEISPDSASSGSPSDNRLVAGQHAVVLLSPVGLPAVQAMSAEELGRRLAWRVPRLEFSGTPLAEVVALFRRHGGVHLEIGDASLAGVRVSGILRADNTAALFQLLAADHAIMAERRGDETVLVRRR